MTHVGGWRWVLTLALGTGAAGQSDPLPPGREAGWSLPQPAIFDVSGSAGGPQGGGPIAVPPASDESQIVRHRVPQSEAATNPEARVVPRGSPTGGWGWQGVVPLLVVLGLIIACAAVVRRFLPGRKLLGGGGAIEVLARYPLSHRQSLILARLGHQVLLLGVTPEQISTLCVVDEPGQAALLRGQAAAAQPESMTNAFAQEFDLQTEAYRQPSSEEELAASAGGGVRGLLEKVRGLRRRGPQGIG